MVAKNIRLVVISDSLIIPSGMRREQQPIRLRRSVWNASREQLFSSFPGTRIARFRSGAQDAHAARTEPDMILRRIVFFLALALGLVASQVPEFAQQYRQRLGGAIDELNRILGEFDADAARMQMDRAAGLDRLLRNTDDFVRQRGEQIRTDAERAARLERELQAYRDAGPFWRLATLARHYEPEIARRAAENFEPAVPVTAEGLIATATGFLIGWLGGRALIAPVQRRRQRTAVNRV